jgi:hypothetical protein
MSRTDSVPITATMTVVKPQTLNARRHRLTGRNPSGTCVANSGLLSIVIRSELVFTSLRSISPYNGIQKSALQSPH